MNSRIDEGTLSGLARAAHAAADFYAHTSYEYFAKRDSSGKLVTYDPQNAANCLADTPDYKSGDFALTNFSANVSKCDNAYQVKAAEYWNNEKILSGRFGQPGDQAQGFLEKVFISIPYALRSAPGFAVRTCLPHHNEIAVDNENKPEDHKLYTDAGKFRDAFNLRREAAVAHIKMLYESWPGKK